MDPMNEDFWLNHKDKDGRIINVEEVKLAIFKGVCFFVESFCERKCFIVTNSRVSNFCELPML